MALRKFALDNTDYRSHEEQQEAIECYLSWRNRTRKISDQRQLFLPLASTMNVTITSAPKHVNS